MEIGKPTHWDDEVALKFLSMLVSCDESLKAQRIMEEMLPEYFIDYPSQALLMWRKSLNEKIITIQDYYKGETHDISEEKVLKEYQIVPRYKAIEPIIAHINSQGRTAYICEFGPGQCWLPVGLKYGGFKFKYHPITITGDLFKNGKELISDVLVNKSEFNQPQVFVCMEVIEHLEHLGTIYNFYCREHLDAEHIVISTPKYTLGGGWKRDHAEMVAHVRTFSPRTLLKFCHRYWPQMQWNLIDVSPEQLMAVGSRINA